MLNERDEKTSSCTLEDREWMGDKAIASEGNSSMGEFVTKIVFMTPNGPFVG